MDVTKSRSHFGHKQKKLELDLVRKLLRKIKDSFVSVGNTGSVDHFLMKRKW